MTGVHGGGGPGAPPRAGPVPDVRAMGLTEAVAAIEAAGAAVAHIAFTGRDGGGEGGRDARGDDGWRVLSQRSEAGGVRLIAARAPVPTIPSDDLS